LVAQSNPHAVLDFKRFQAQECAAFISFQAQILKSKISSFQYVTTNYMHFCEQTQPDLNKDLDFVSYTIYPVGGIDAGYGDQGFRTGNSHRIGFANDYYKNITGNTGVFEVQPGQVNWGPKYNPLPQPGAVRMWIWHIVAGGNKFVCSYRFRQPLYGVEQYHHGIMKPDGVTLSQGGKEYLQVINELKKVREVSNASAREPQRLTERKIAVLFNMDNYWETNNQKQTVQWSYDKHFYKYYDVLKKLGAPVSFIQEDADFTKYPFLLAPAYQLLDSTLVARWTKYVEAGGNLILTCRTGQKDRNAHLWESNYAAPIINLIGAEVLNYDVLPENYKAQISFNKKNYSWNNWGDILELRRGNTEVLSYYTDQFYKDKPAVITRKLGKGSVTYIGVDSDEGELEFDVLKEVYTRANVSTEAYPEGLIVEWRDGLWYAINYATRPVEVKLPEKAQIIIGTAILKQTEVLIWKE
jgi:beta-galactosidase